MRTISINTDELPLFAVINTEGPRDNSIIGYFFHLSIAEFFADRVSNKYPTGEYEVVKLYESMERIVYKNGKKLSF